MEERGWIQTYLFVAHPSAICEYLSADILTGVGEGV